MKYDKLTSARINALKAVDRDEVKHIYRVNGNVYRAPKGVGPSAMRTLERMDMIQDGPGKSTGIQDTVPVILTKKGQAHLALDTGGSRAAGNRLAGILMKPRIVE